MYQSIHGAGLLVMLKPRSLFSRDVDQARELIALGVMASAVSQENLDHARVIPRVVARPWRTILHDPAFGRDFHGFCHQRVDPNFELFVLPLPKNFTDG